MKISINPDRMRYQKNTLSFWMCILAIMMNVISLIVIFKNVPIDSTQPPLLKLGGRGISPGVAIGADVVCNIVLFMMFFLTAEKTKSHELFWGKASFGFGGIQFARIFIIPLIFFVRKEITFFNFFVSAICYLVSAAALVFAGIVCVIRSKALNAYLATIDEPVSGH